MTGRPCTHGPATLLSKRLVRNVFLGSWVLALAVQELPVGAAKTPASTSPGLRYVLLVDTSVHMTGQKDALAQVVTEQIASGFDGQASPGEMFVLWPFSSAAWTNAFLPVTWTPRTKELYAKRMGRAVEDQAFSGAPSLGPVLNVASSVIRSTDNLTLFIFTDGTVPIVGTSFDQPINACYAQARHLAAGAPELLLTTLVAQGGSIVRWSVAKLATGSSQLIQPSSEPATPTLAAARIAPPRPAQATHAVAQIDSASSKSLSAQPVPEMLKPPVSPAGADKPFGGELAVEDMPFADGVGPVETPLVSRFLLSDNAAPGPGNTDVPENKGEKPGAPVATAASGDPKAEKREFASLLRNTPLPAERRGELSSGHGPGLRAGAQNDAAAVPIRNESVSTTPTSVATDGAKPSLQVGKWIYLGSGLSLFAVAGWCLAKYRVAPRSERHSSLISQSFKAGIAVRPKSTTTHPTCSGTRHRPEPQPALGNHGS